MAELDGFFNYADGELLLSGDGRVVGVHHLHATTATSSGEEDAEEAHTARASRRIASGQGAEDEEKTPSEGKGAKLCAVARCDGSDDM